MADPTGSSSPTHTFLGVAVQTDGDVLVPRPETELVGRTALELISERSGSLTVVDMCCGSGNLALAIAHHVPSASVWACDITDDTIAVARRNADRLGLNERITVCKGDLFGALDSADLGDGADLVVCNPPYISSNRLKNESAHLLAEEPREAFDGGPYGISILQRLVKEAPAHLKDGGWLAFEFGEGQGNQALRLLRRAKCYVDIRLVANEDGTPRVAVARKGSPE